MFNTVIYLLIINTLNDSLCKKVVDYFDENFDENKNCKHEAEMKQLMGEKDDNHEMRRCATVSFSGDHITEAHSWEECKKRISQKLNHEACNGMGFEDVGSLFDNFQFFYFQNSLNSMESYFIVKTEEGPHAVLQKRNVSNSSIQLTVL